MSGSGLAMSNPRRRPRYIWIATVVLLLGGAALFSLKAIGRGAPKIDAEKLARVERMDLARSVVATGKVEPTTKVEIKSKASGIILRLPVNVGDVVHAGQMICELDRNDLEPRLREAKAALAVNEAVLKTARAECDRYKIEAIGPDLPFLKRDLERARRLFSDHLIAQNARDEAEKNYELALNRKQMAEGNLPVAEGCHRARGSATGTAARGRRAFRRGPSQCHHHLAHRRCSSGARSRSGRCRKLHPHYGLGRYGDHDARRSGGSLREGQSRRERHRKGL